jgi:AcrR family transcriptional regulator
MGRLKRISDAAVLDGALKVMRRTGPSAFTLAAAGAEVGLSPATLMLRFGDKQGLIVQAIARDGETFDRLLDEAPRARGREAVLDLFWLLTPEAEDPAALAEDLAWLRDGFRDPALHALAQQRSRRLRAAITARLPPLRIDPDLAAGLMEAQWQGAMNQWGVFPEGRLADHVARSLNAWLDLAEAPQR